MPAAQDLPVSAGALGLALLLAALLVLLVAFPAELFNKTYEENEEDIHRFLSRLGWRRHHLPPRLGLAAFLLIGGGLLVWLALSEPTRGNRAAIAVGVCLALPVVTFANRLPTELYERARSAAPGSLHVLPSALLVAGACAAMSRLLSLQPAYLYGLFAGFAAVEGRRLTHAQEGMGILLGVVTLGAVGLLAWVGWGALGGADPSAHRSWLETVAASALFWTFIMASEGLVFALVPLQFLDGAVLRRWRLRAWLIPQLLAAMFFAYVLMLHGTVERIDSIQQLIKPLAFFVGFGVLSFSFWGYFRWRRYSAARRSGLARGGGDPGGGLERADDGVLAAKAGAAELGGD